jgi:hypothetical protein
VNDIAVSPLSDVDGDAPGATIGLGDKLHETRSQVATSPATAAGPAPQARALSWPIQELQSRA